MEDTQLFTGKSWLQVEHPDELKIYVETLAFKPLGRAGVVPRIDYHLVSWTVRVACSTVISQCLGATIRSSSHGWNIPHL